MCLRPRPCSAFSGCLPSYKYRLLGQIPRINHRELICSLLTASLQFPYNFLTVSLQFPYSLLCLLSLLFWRVNHIANCMLARHRCASRGPDVVVMSATNSVVSGTSSMALVNHLRPDRPVPTQTSCCRKCSSIDMVETCRNYGRLDIISHYLK